jgi:hypothetical protein
MQTYWFVTLLSAICLEGLGRKYLPSVPSALFYFFKDLVLLSGYFVLRVPPEIKRTAKALFGGFTPLIVAAIAWTVLECLNPASQSIPLSLIGLRAYWLWWVAPVIVATALSSTQHKNKAIYALLVFSLGISVLAAVQFASPPTSAVNLYSTVNGEEIYADVATVAATGRARVSGTFSFLSGFVSFTMLIPTLLLSLGLEARDPKLRRWSLIVTLCCASVVPMSGSRGSVVLGALMLAITAWAAGLLFTVIGRRIVLGGMVAVVLSLVAFPDAYEGVQSRFEDSGDTSSRVQEAFVVLPPLALTTYDYPLMGIGTGSMQNARTAMGLRSTEWEAEGEIARYLVELGPVGYMLVWLSRLALAITLVRAYKILKRAGRRGASGAALSYALLAMTGNPVFDHIFQALFFMGCGFILAEVVEAQRSAPPAVSLAVPR